MFDGGLFYVCVIASGLVLVHWIYLSSPLKTAASNLLNRRRLVELSWRCRGGGGGGGGVASIHISGSGEKLQRSLNLSRSFHLASGTWRMRR